MNIDRSHGDGGLPPSPFEVVYFKEVLMWIKSSLDGTQLECIEMLIAGYNEDEISGLENIDRRLVVSMISKARDTLRNNLDDVDMGI